MKLEGFGKQGRKLVDIYLWLVKLFLYTENFRNLEIIGIIRSNDPRVL